MDGEGDTDAFHLRKFKCFPPGDFPGAYVSSRAAKEVAKAPKWSRRASRASTFSTWDRPLYRGEAARGATQESRGAQLPMGRGRCLHDGRPKTPGVPRMALVAGIEALPHRRQTSWRLSRRRWRLSQASPRRRTRRKRRKPRN